MSEQKYTEAQLRSIFARKVCREHLDKIYKIVETIFTGLTASEASVIALTIFANAAAIKAVEAMCDIDSTKETGLSLDPSKVEEAVRLVNTLSRKGLYYLVLQEILGAMTESEIREIYSGVLKANRDFADMAGGVRVVVPTTDELPEASVADTYKMLLDAEAEALLKAKEEFMERSLDRDVRTILDKSETH